MIFTYFLHGCKFSIFPVSVIDVRFVKNILTKESPPIMVLNTYPEVARSKFTCHLYAINSLEYKT